MPFYSNEKDHFVGDVYQSQTMQAYSCLLLTWTNCYVHIYLHGFHLW